MSQEDYLQPLTHCTLCEHRCGVNRLEGQTGICRMTVPAMASASLHPALPESYSVFSVTERAYQVHSRRSAVRAGSLVATVLAEE